jgi:hypothetical protein
MACRRPFPPFLIRMHTVGRKATGPLRRGRTICGTARDWRAAPAWITLRYRPGSPCGTGLDRLAAPAWITLRYRPGSPCGTARDGVRRGQDGLQAQPGSPCGTGLRGRAAPSGPEAGMRTFAGRPPAASRLRLARPLPPRFLSCSRRAGHSAPLRESRIPFPARFPTRETPIVGRCAPRESVNAGQGAVGIR